MSYLRRRSNKVIFETSARSGSKSEFTANLIKNSGKFLCDYTLVLNDEPRSRFTNELVIANDFKDAEDNLVARLSETYAHVSKVELIDVIIRVA